MEQQLFYKCICFTYEFVRMIGNSRKALEDVLDTCLLSDKEMKEYEEIAALGSDLNLSKLYFPEG